ncbi:MAG TPA: protein kinase [Polyangiaceae bacterium]|nr:protein kinase [Polyangiaceae bacterium]
MRSALQKAPAFSQPSSTFRSRRRCGLLNAMTDSGEDPFDWVGATLDGKYQIDAVVGRGGFGVVYRAHHLGFKERVAIKCLRIPRSLSGEARDEFERNFLAEGRLLHQLSRSTAGIVQALDVGAAVSPNKSWTPFIVLEWLEGQSLEQNFAQRLEAGLGGRSLQAAVELLDSAARALSLAHEQGIAHRDIKPANLFLAEVGGRTTLKVLDFGIAKVVSESQSFTKAFEETGASLQAFTARYGSPEQFSRRFGATGPWSDVFSLALVLVEAIVGHSALSGVDSTQLFVAAADPAHRPTPRAHGVELPAAVEAVFATALAVEPKDRYANAGEFWAALSAALAASGEIAPSLASAGPSRRETAKSLERITRAEDTAPRAQPPLGAAPATELTASTPLPKDRPASAQSARRRADGLQRVTAAAVLLMLGLAAFALWRARTPTFSARGVNASASENPSPPAAPSERTSASSSAATSASEHESPKVSPPPHSAASPALPAEHERESDASATKAPDSAAPAANNPGLPGLRTRDVPAGLVPESGAWLGKFGLLQREDGPGLPYAEAFKRCVSSGKTLCTDGQWQRACDSFPEIAQTPSWTESLDGAQVVVRGGGSCSARKLVGASEADPQRFGLCCDRAIAVDSSSVQKKSSLSSTAEVVLELENALNQRSVAKFLELSDDHVTLNDHARDKAGLKRVLTQSFASARDLLIVNDQCEISMSAKKIVIKKPHRAKKTSYETTGWTAVCRQTRHRDQKSVAGKSSYDFSASSKLRAITDSESPSE